SCLPALGAVSLFVYSYLAPRGLPSFPTRRSSDLRLCVAQRLGLQPPALHLRRGREPVLHFERRAVGRPRGDARVHQAEHNLTWLDRKSTRLNSSHDQNSYAVFCLKKKSYNSLRTA